MVRTQVQLTGDQIRSLRQASAETGKSIAQLVRMGVEIYLSSQHRPSRPEQIERAIRATGRFSFASSGSTDVSIHHDRYLAEAFKG